MARQTTDFSRYCKSGVSRVRSCCRVLLEPLLQNVADSAAAAALSAAVVAVAAPAIQNRRLPQPVLLTSPEMAEAVRQVEATAAGEELFER